MTKNLKVFFLGFLVTLPFWWALNIFHESLEDFFFGLELTYNPHLFVAQAALQKELEDRRPLPNREAIPFKLTSASALSVFIGDSEEKTKVLFEHSAEKKLAIASLTKLMGALVVARHIPLDKEIQIPREAVLEEEDFGQLREGDRFFARDLLYPLLMESSNDASAAFAFKLGNANFLRLMNQEADFLGMKDTFFVNHAGLDSNIPEGPVNYSTAGDLLLLTRHLKTFYPSVFKILGLPEHTLYTADGKFHHTMENTNQLLSSNGWAAKVLAGKTGWTPEAKGALVLVLESPKKKGYLINIILGSDRRFQDMEELVNWVFNSYRF